MTQPKMQAIVEKLNGVLKGENSRDEVADWSFQFINDDDIVIEDSKAWELLKIVGSIDLCDSPESYLYSVEDIKSWIEEYSN